MSGMEFEKRLAEMSTYCRYLALPREGGMGPVILLKLMLKFCSPELSLMNPVRLPLKLLFPAKIMLANEHISATPEERTDLKPNFGHSSGVRHFSLSSCVCPAVFKLGLLH